MITYPANRKHNVSEDGSVSIFRLWETPTPLGPLERGNLNHSPEDTNRSSFRSPVYPSYVKPQWFRLVRSLQFSCGFWSVTDWKGGGGGSVASVHKRTIPKERPPLVSEVSANFFAVRGCHVVSVMNPYGRILGFLDRSRYFFFQAAPPLYKWSWVDSVPDPLPPPPQWNSYLPLLPGITVACVRLDSFYLACWHVVARGRGGWCNWDSPVETALPVVVRRKRRTYKETYFALQIRVR
jgi:hypothetical protein